MRFADQLVQIKDRKDFVEKLTGGKIPLLGSAPAAERQPEAAPREQLEAEEVLERAREAAAR